MMAERTNKSTCIYKISSLLKPEMFYIGSAYNFQARKLKHLSSLRRNLHVNNYLQNHYNKYGSDDLKFEILEIIDNKENIITREQYYLDILNPTFNFCKTAGNCAGRIPTEKTKDKIRNSLIGIKHSEERKLNLRKGHSHEFKSIEITKEGKITVAESIAEAVRITGVPKSGVKRCCQKQYYSYKGYKFKFHKYGQ